jgi:hypothetical protein
MPKKAAWLGCSDAASPTKLAKTVHGVMEGRILLRLP